MESISHRRNNDVFQRYWRSYDRAMAWYRKHKVAIWKSEAAAQSYLKSAFEERIHLERNDPSKEQMNLRDDMCMSVDEENQEDSESEENQENAESEEFEFEITEDMMEFFETSRKHKEELRLKKLADKKKEEQVEYINLEDYYEGRTNDRSNLPPEKQPGASYAAEMKELYGDSAPMIHGMETAIRLNHDRHCDIKQPKLWPNIPIKIILD